MPERKPESDLLATLEPLSALSPARRAELAALGRLESISAGMPLFREGERDNGAVYLLAGRVAMHSARFGILPSIRAGDTRHPLADRQPRQVTAVAESDCEILRLDSDALEAALVWEAMADNTSNTGEAGGHAAWMSRLKQALAFRGLPPANIAALATRVERLPVNANQTILEEGDEGDYYYILEEGRAAVWRRENGATREVAELAPGDAFGEEALVSGAQRNATVIMKTAGHLLRLAKQDFIALLRAPLLRWLRYDEAAAKVAAGEAVWLDVRHEIEYRHVHVPGARSCPL
ncbi:MAG: cyclic nucleotide-binding domain-containing protein, partial [Gammaproteobacteria bacterium]|nr:cyclic nucleotide-binding domain-containing protein [Gammaproteobacteria bacterium]